uniref:aldo/keto reductase n=1 Tax=Enterocloster aldenensis TaxID=358742 RepID=UPI0022E04E23
MGFKLSNGLELPQVAFGTFNAGDGDETTEIVEKAIKTGYLQIDTASIYKNEANIGVAIKNVAPVINRRDLIISSKVWNPDQGYENTLEAFKKSCDLLKTDYLDIYLIHWPVPYGREKNYQEVNYSTWRAFERLYREGKVKAIGVSNFLPRHLQPLLQKADIKPMINQIEIHPCYQQRENVEFCQQEGILVQAWSPFMRGDVFQLPLLHHMAEKYQRSISQICLAWCLQRGIQPIPKASNEKRMTENLGPFDFFIDNEDMKQMETLDCEDGHAPFKDYELQKKY